MPPTGLNSFPGRPVVLILAAISLLACSISVPDLSNVPGLREPTPIPSPTPKTDSISFQTLTYRIALEEGEGVPGTGLVYRAKTNEGFAVDIDGLSALKKSGDSFTWRGVVAPGVVGKYDLRITTTLIGDLIALGPVQINILNPTPLELGFTQPAASPLEFEELLIDYQVPIGQVIPGTTISYIGLTDQGGQLAGTSGYPYIQQADSFTWLGQLRDNVIVQYQLRVATISEDQIRLVGTAKLWIYP